MRPTVKIASYRHEAPTSTQEPDTASGSYYVSIRDGARVGLLLGPYYSHDEALAMVDCARAIADRCNPAQAAFAGFGTLRMPVVFVEPGKLNDLVEG